MNFKRPYNKYREELETVVRNIEAQTDNWNV